MSRVDGEGGGGAIYRWLRRLLLFGVSLLLSLVLLDLYLQSAEIQRPMENRLVPRIGLMYAPDFRFSRFSEGFYLGRTNEVGCLGRSAPRERDPGTTRILFLGDSFVLGHTVFDRHHFGRAIERAVSNATGRPAEVLNFARADFALTNMVQHYHDFASRWSPDLALFFVDQSDLDPPRQASGSFYPVAMIEADTLAYDYGFESSRKARMFARYGVILNLTVFPKLVFEFLKQVDRGELPHLLFDKLRPAPPPDNPPPSLARDAAARPMPELTRLALAQLAKRPETVVVLSGPTSPDYVDAIRAQGIRVLDLNPVFAALAARGTDPYFWPVTGERGHWNHAAHQAIGESLGESLLPILRSEAR